MKAKAIPLIPFIALAILCLWFFLFVSNGSTSSSQWLGFAFAAISCLLPLVPWLVGGREYVGAATLWSVTYIFSVVELIASIIVMLIAPSDWKIPLFVLILILTAFIIVFLLSWRANVATEAAQQATQADRRMQQNWASLLHPLLADRSLTPEQRKIVEKAYDAVRSTPVKTDSQTSQIDELISIEIQSLLFAASQTDTADIEAASNKIQSLAKERRIALSGLNR